MKDSIYSWFMMIILVILFIILPISLISGCDGKDSNGNYTAEYKFTIKGNEIYKFMDDAGNFQYVSIIPKEDGENKNVNLTVTIKSEKPKEKKKQQDNEE